MSDSDKILIGLLIIGIILISECIFESESKTEKSSERERPLFTSNNLKILYVGWEWAHGPCTDLDCVCEAYCNYDMTTDLLCIDESTGERFPCYADEYKNWPYQIAYVSFNLLIPSGYLDPSGTVCDPECKDYVKCTPSIDGVKSTQSSSYRESGQYRLGSAAVRKNYDFTKSHTLTICCDEICESERVESYCNCETAL